MNFRLVLRQLGMVSLLIGGAMMLSLPWAFPELGFRKHLDYDPSTPSWDGPTSIEWLGIRALIASIVVCAFLGGLMRWVGRGQKGKLRRKEAMAVVGLSWILATLLGALPYYFANVGYCPSVRVLPDHELAYVHTFHAWDVRDWKKESDLSSDELAVLSSLLDAAPRKLTRQQLIDASEVENPDELLRELSQSDRTWRRVLMLPNVNDAESEQAYAIRSVRMGVIDCLFESQSGFSTTGATVISSLEDSSEVPHCILFWRSSTHFLGGLGIIVLFVVILGQGSAGKALMRVEMPGPTQEQATPRVQKTAWLFTGMYCSLNLVLAIVLWLEGMSPFDAICHAFGTLATGGFSTYDASLGHFGSPLMEFTILVFMVLAGTNFVLLFLCIAWKPKPWKLLGDLEWRVYMIIIGVVTVAVVSTGLASSVFPNFWDALRLGLFQVVSIITTTGYVTDDFDRWNSTGRGLLLLLMFVGGCAGSTGGGMKVIRHILFVKILHLELELAFHPTVVRSLRLGEKPVEDQSLRKSIPIYFGLIGMIFVMAWFFVIATEPQSTWGPDRQQKLIDSASAVIATLNNIGPGLGIVGSASNYASISSVNKFLFTWLMMIGRLEVFAIVVLFMPRFWRDR